MKYICCMCDEPTDNEEEMCDKCKIEYGYVERKKCMFCGKEIEPDMTVCANCEKAYKIMLSQQHRQNETIAEKAETKQGEMFCINCGKKIEQSVLFCPHCGYSYKKELPKEKVIKAEPAIRALCYIVNIILLVFGSGVIGGLIAPVVWGIGFSIYCYTADETKYDVSYYETLRNENFAFAIATAIVTLMAFIK